MKCLEVRNQINAEALCCLNPEETPMGFKVNVLVTHRGIEIPMKFLEEHCELRLYCNPRGAYSLYKEKRCVQLTDCPPSIITILKQLDINSIEYELLIHTVFCNMMRKIRKMKPDKDYVYVIYTAWDVAAYIACHIDGVAASHTAADIVDNFFIIERIIANYDLGDGGVVVREAARKAFKFFIKLRKIIKNRL